MSKCGDTAGWLTRAWLLRACCNNMVTSPTRARRVVRRGRRELATLVTASVGEASMSVQVGVQVAGVWYACSSCLTASRRRVVCALHSMVLVSFKHDLTHGHIHGIGHGLS